MPPSSARNGGDFIETKANQMSLLSCSRFSSACKPSRLETLDLLEASKQNYQGVARLGIEALALKVQGMRITDIAALYQVPPSHVGAWISRSLEKLRNDPDFLTCLL